MVVSSYTYEDIIFVQKDLVQSDTTIFKHLSQHYIIRLSVNTTVFEIEIILFHLILFIKQIG